MISRMSSGGLSTTAAVFAAVLLVNAFNAADALGGALGGVGNAVGGALGGIGGAINGGGGSGGAGNAGSGGASANNGARASSGGSGVSSQSGAAAASSGRHDVSVDDQERCRNTLLNLLRGRDCDDQHASLPEADMDELEQASMPPVDEPPIPRSKPARKAGQLQPQLRKKPAAPQSTARLIIEKPAAEKPKLGTSAAVEKAQPKSEPALSCDKAGAIIGEYGFRAVEASDCDGEVYGFNARRDGKAFTVTLNAMSGELVTVRKVP